jgi:magnesium chelatase subunit D
VIVFPLTAIVGQEQLIEALLINVVAPDVGGLLVRGERGTAKTTAVRGLASLLAPASLVELPLGTTLDRLVGSLDIREALAGGEHRFEPGMLHRANGGILYVDEVNLLADHLVDALLDAAATGVARVEREAVSVTHEARFMLVGTMNIEEGDLRPQLLDRFGLGVEVKTPEDPATRAEIVRRRLRFESDPEAFAAEWTEAETKLAERLADARARLEQVVLPERELMRITGACAALNVDGVRGDIVTARAARALAALEGVPEVSEDHVRRAAELALFHRRRRDPLSGQAPNDDQLQRALDDAAPEPQEASDNDNDNDDDPPPGDGVAPERRDAPVDAKLPPGALSLPDRGRGPLGRRARSGGSDAGAIDTRRASPESDDLAIVGTLRARLLGAEPDHLREHVRAGREGAFLCLVVDASGSMGARRRAARVKGALIGLLRDAYARRDRVGVIAFRDANAEILVPPGAPLEHAAAQLTSLPTGGRTPLAAGLRTAEALIRRERSRDPRRRSVAIVLTDGRVGDPNGAIRDAAASLGHIADAVQVIDTEDGPVRVGLAGELALAARGELHTLRAA